VRIEKGGQTRTLLFDTGVSANGMVEKNRRRISFPGLLTAELPPTSRRALEEMGFAIVEEPAVVLA
jgi:hypothetical protein